MTKIVSIAQMAQIEAAADRAGVTYAILMEAAGRAVAQVILARATPPAEQQVVILCGKGNNGGDGLVAAHYLAMAGVRALTIYGALPFAESANLRRVHEQGLRVIEAQTDPSWQSLSALLENATVVVDAVFGTGARLPLTGAPAEVLLQTKHSLARRAQRPLCVAVDCPSGLNCDTGELDQATLPADLTVTFAAAKLGQFTFPAAEVLGELHIADIGIDAHLPELAQVQIELGTAEKMHALLPPRPRYAHKGTFGRALVVAGSMAYTGAAYLAGAAAYRSGAGLVTLAVPAPLHPILAGQLPEATWLLLPHERGVIAEEGAEVLLPELTKTQALLIGPGFGLEKPTAAFVRRLLEHAAQLPPLVIDADGLKLITQIEQWPQALPPQSVLTPHLGEMSVLTGLDKTVLQKDRLGVAQKFARDWNQVVVLKGAFTIVAAPDGRTTLQPFATAALARAGTGDVLAGIITGLLAQGLKPYEAAVAGTYWHGQAGLHAAEKMNAASVLASDVLEGMKEKG